MIFPQLNFHYIFRSFDAEEIKDIPETDDETHGFKAKSILELTHNYGTEDDKNLIIMMEIKSHVVLVILFLKFPMSYMRKI